MLHTNEEHARPNSRPFGAPKTVIANWDVWPKYVEPVPKKRGRKPKLDCSKISLDYQIKLHAKSLKA